MNVYKIKILKISGGLNESAEALPKSVIYKSKTAFNEREVFNKAAKYVRNKYGVVLEAADISPVEDYDYRDNKHVAYWTAPLNDKKIKHVISVLVDLEGCTELDAVMNELVDQYGPDVDSLDMEERISKCAYQMVHNGEIDKWAWMG